MRTWESLDHQLFLDPEVIDALARLYIETHQVRGLTALIARIDQEAELVSRHRSTMIQIALSLESRFAHYTEAFKCWLALYEHSPRDRYLCIHAFHRLTARDVALRPLICELYKLRVNHAVSSAEKRILLSELSEMLYQDQRWDLACETLERELALNITDERDALLRIEEYATPLGMWEWAAQMSSSLSSWRAARFTAEVIETRLGDHAQAGLYYQEALTRLDQSLNQSSLANATLDALRGARAQLSSLLKRERYAPEIPPEVPELSVEDEFPLDDHSSTSPDIPLIKSTSGSHRSHEPASDT